MIERLVILAAVLAAVAVANQWWRARDGRVHTDLGGSSRGPTPAADIVAWVNPTTPLTLVEFTAPDCVPCAATAEVLVSVSRRHNHVGIAEIDVAEGLELARAHRIMRAPTTVLIDDGGALLGRVSGIPSESDLDALIAQAGVAVTSG